MEYEQRRHGIPCVRLILGHNQLHAEWHRLFLRRSLLSQLLLAFLRGPPHPPPQGTFAPRIHAIRPKADLSH